MTPEPRLLAALGAMVAWVAASRVLELVRSRRNLRVMRERGAVEFGRTLFPLFVAFHVLLPVSIVAEVVVLGARPSAAWPAWLFALVVAASLRFTAMRALGERWNVRVWVVPGESPVATGIYRWLRHPNYVAVILECAALPLLFGCWRTAIVASAINLVLLTQRIPVEERALAWAAAQPAATASGSPLAATGAGVGSSTRNTSSVMSS